MSDENFEEIKLTALYYRSQVINMIEDYILELDQHLGKKPVSTDPINRPGFYKWCYLGMARVGELKGVLAISKMLGLITPEQYKGLFRKALGKIHNMTAAVMMGTRNG